METTAQLCLPPHADIGAWQAWTDTQHVHHQLKDVLMFTLETVENCTRGLLITATTRHAVTAVPATVGQSWARFGVERQAIDLPVNSPPKDVVCRTCRLAWKPRKCDCRLRQL